MVPWGLIALIFLATPAAQLIEANENYQESDKKTDENVAADLMEKMNVSVSLDRMELNELPEGFVRSEYLTHLNLRNNRIKSLPFGAFEFVPRLSNLDLKNNFLGNIDLGQFSQISNLQTLNLDGNCKPTLSRIEVPWDSMETTTMYRDYGYYGRRASTARPEPRDEIVEAFIPCEATFSGEFPHLSTLYLRNNSLSRLKIKRDMILPRLTHLDLSDNLLYLHETTMSDLGKIIPSISEFRLKNSNISEFDVSVFPSVESLFMDYNKIGIICNEYCDRGSLSLKGAKNLKVLSVSHNEIMKIESDSFNYTKNLVSLHLSHNAISEIREGTFEKLNLLEYLDLQFNGIVKLNAVDTFKGLIKLEQLFLGHNYLRNVTSETFHDLIAWNTIALDNNKISSIGPATFSDLINLRSISLASNQLSTIPEGSLPNSSSLVDLRLDNNQFTNTEHIFVPDSPNLLILSLKNNPLEIVSVPWHSNWYKNLTIVLGNACDYSSAQLEPESASSSSVNLFPE